MPDDFFVPVAERYLWVVGKVSASQQEALSSASALPKQCPTNAIPLFLDYANMEVPVGHIFDVIFHRHRPLEHTEATCRILAVTDTFAQPRDFVPRGWNTVSILEFPAGIPDVIQGLPLWDDRSKTSSIGLTTKETWSLLTEPPGTERWKAERLWKYTPLGVEGFYFTCPHCRQCVDAGYRWAYWNLQIPSIVSAEATVSVDNVLNAVAYWNFPSFGDRRDQLTAQALANTREFLVTHRDHQVRYQSWRTCKDYVEFGTFDYD